MTIRRTPLSNRIGLWTAGNVFGVAAFFAAMTYAAAQFPPPPPATDASPSGDPATTSSPDTKPATTTAPAAKPATTTAAKPKPVRLSISLEVTKSDSVPDSVDPNTGMNKNSTTSTTVYSNGMTGVTTSQTSNIDSIYKLHIVNNGPVEAADLTIEYHIYVETAISSDDGSVKSSIAIKDVTSKKTITMPGNSEKDLTTQKVTSGNKSVPIVQTQNQGNYYGQRTTPKYVRTVITILGYHITIKQGDTEVAHSDNPMDVVEKVDQINKRNDAIKNGTSAF